jgi:integrase
MSRNPNRGRVYRRCACRDATGAQLGARCPDLTNRRHGRWAFAVDLPTIDRERKTLRRCGFPTKAHAHAALHRVLACERAGIHIDDRQTVAEYLEAWLEVKQHSLKPTTMVRYHDYVHKDLSPALGPIRLEELTHHHVAAFVSTQLAAGRGRVTIHRCVATLSSALTDAVRHHRLIHNPARYANILRPRAAEQACWTPEQAVTFLRHCAKTHDPLAELYELIICTGMRKGEALALHWADVDLDANILFVRYTLSNINNTTPVFTSPKTKSSHTWIGLSPRAMRALRRQAERQDVIRRIAGPAFQDQDLVFTRPRGQPLRPEYVLRHLHELISEADLPRIRVHDLRHFAATTMLSSQVPLAMASKTMRHSTLSTTTEVYGHLLRHVAQQAVEAIDLALTAAENATARRDDHTAITRRSTHHASHQHRSSARSRWCP